MSAKQLPSHLRWGPAGEASALFRIEPPGSGEHVGRLIVALGAQPAPAVVTWGPGADDWRVCIGVGVPRARSARSVLQAASHSVLHPFGLDLATPGPRGAGAWAASSDRQAAALAPFSPRPCGIVESQRTAAPLREVAGCGYAVARGEPRYVGCFTAWPGGPAVRWPLPGGTRPWRSCVAVRPGGTAPRVAFVAGVEAPDFVALAEAAAHLAHELRACGWDAVRPGSGQARLAAVLATGDAWPPLPGGLFFAMPGAQEAPQGPAAPGPEGTGTDDPGGRGGGPAAVRVARGPRRGLVVPLDGPLDVGRGGPGLDLADEEVRSRHLRLEPGPRGAILRCAPGGDVLVDGEPASGERVLRPGASLRLGRSELVLRRCPLPRRSPRMAEPPSP